jgi:hypothetical protein
MKLKEAKYLRVTGAASFSIDAITSILCKASTLLTENKEIKEFDFNPIFYILMVQK